MGYYTRAECDLAAFEAEVSRALEAGSVPRAARIVSNIPVYRCADISGDLGDAEGRRGLMAEWAWVLKDGPGVLALDGALTDIAVIDRVSEVYRGIIAEEKAHAGGGVDHFAAAGANDRIWNSLQKLCLADPEAFALYFAAPPIDAVAEAWLGPGYQMTAQVNLVRPGGAAQQAHRDYHLGFQDEAAAGRFPAHVHDLSPVMTLQGAVAHCDMPVESGPTKLLPYSQSYGPGYMAYRLEEFQAFFDANCVQVPLKTGDAVFFNPALFHAAGANVSADIERMANLLQVSSPFGRAMEAVDRDAMCRALFPALRGLIAEGRIGGAALDAAISAAAEGYSFPTNLDTDPPVGGLAPETQGAILRRGLETGMDERAFGAELDAYAARRRA